MTIDLTKPVVTKLNKCKVRILCTDAPGEYPIVGIIEGSSAIVRWNMNGENAGHHINDYRDLINEPEPPKSLGWLVLYKNKERYIYDYPARSLSSVNISEIESVHHLIYVEGELQFEKEDINKLLQ